NGTLSVDGSLDLNATVGTNGTNTVTVSGLASDVNTVLASLSYTASTEFEGADTLNVTATSKDGAAAVSGVSNDATVGITINPVSDTPSVAAATATVALDENTSTAISGVSGTPATGDASDPVTVTLHVTNGTLSLAGTLAAPVGNNGTDTVTVSGLASDVNAVL